MTIYLAGTGPYIFETPYNSGVSLGTSGIDTGWVSSSLNFGNTSSNQDTIPFTAPISEGWFHFEASYSGSTSGTTRSLVQVLNSGTGNARIRMTRNGAGTNMNCDFFDGAAWVTAGTIPHTGGRRQFDIYYRADDTNGAVEFYVAKELVASFYGDTTGIGTVNKLRFGNPASFGSDSCQISQVLVADFPTLFAKVKQTLFNADGFHTSWTGTVLSVDEANPSSADFIYTDTADNKETFKAAARSYTGYEVKGLITMFDALRGGASAPPNIRAMMRIGGTDYYGPQYALAFGKQNFIDQWTVNPATGLPWTVGDAGDANLEVGVQARGA